MPYYMPKTYWHMGVLIYIYMNGILQTQLSLATIFSKQLKEGSICGNLAVVRLVQHTFIY